MITLVTQKMAIDREVICEDAILWLTNNKIDPQSSLMVSLPDISEFPHLSLEEWRIWFFETAKLVLSRTPDQSVTVFYQTDIKVEGTWIDKAFICQKAAESLGHPLLWHKLVCRTKPGTASFGRPAYSHLLCFSKNVRLTDLSRSTPDVIPELGEKTWERGMGLSTGLLISKFILENTNSHTIINPFCGEGSMLAAANAMGLNAIGIERSPKRGEKAKRLEVSADLKNWMQRDLK